MKRDAVIESARETKLMKTKNNIDGERYLATFTEPMRVQLVEWVLNSLNIYCMLLWRSEIQNIVGYTGNKIVLQYYHAECYPTRDLSRQSSI